MSYNNNGYGQGQQQQGYGQYNPYGQSGNPYAQPQQSNPYAQQQAGYGEQGAYNTQPSHGNQGDYSSRPDLSQQASSRYDEESQQGGYEMSNMASRDPNRILNEVRNTDRALTEVEGDMQRLSDLRHRLLETVNPTQREAILKDTNQLDSSIFEAQRGLLERAKRIKADPESKNPRNSAQVNKLYRRIEQVKNRYQQLQSQFNRESNEQIARQVRITEPDATEAQIQEAIDNGPSQVFTQALMNTDRRGQAQSTLENVRRRHNEIQKIEQQMVQLAQLFNEFEAIVVQQEPAVTNIEQKGEEVTDHVGKANTELDGAVKKARSARRKKWICFGIVVAIIIILALGIGLGVGIAVNH